MNQKGVHNPKFTEGNDDLYMTSFNETLIVHILP